MILAGELPAGSHFAELSIVEKLGFSRTLIREALVKLLEQEGLQDALPNGGYAVKTFSERVAAPVVLNEQFHALLSELSDSRVIAKELERVCSLPFASPSGFVIVQANTPKARTCWRWRKISTGKCWTLSTDTKARGLKA